MQNGFQQELFVNDVGLSTTSPVGSLLRITLPSNGNVLFNQNINGLLLSLKVSFLGSRDIPYGQFRLNAGAALHLNIPLWEFELNSHKSAGSLTPYVSVLDDKSKYYVVSWVMDSPLPIIGNVSVQYDAPTPLFDSATTIYVGYEMLYYQNMLQTLRSQRLGGWKNE